MEKCVKILLFGRCKMLNSLEKKMGHKMGIGYVFQEEALF